MSARRRDSKQRILHQDPQAMRMITELSERISSKSLHIEKLLWVQSYQSITAKNACWTFWDFRLNVGQAL